MTAPRARRSRTRVALAPDRAALAATVLGLVSLPGVASAEGAARVLDCTLDRACDAAGACKPESAHLVFRMEPIETHADGSGRYTLRYGDDQAEMQAMSFAGPFLWRLPTERDSLLVSSETKFLWHRLVLEPAPAATIHFLTCEFRQ
jgi:hypothetical protein